MTDERTRYLVVVSRAGRHQEPLAYGPFEHDHIAARRLKQVTARGGRAAVIPLRRWPGPEHLEGTAP